MRPLFLAGPPWGAACFPPRNGEAGAETSLPAQPRSPPPLSQEVFPGPDPRDPPARPWGSGLSRTHTPGRRDSALSHVPVWGRGSHAPRVGGAGLPRGSECRGLTLAAGPRGLASEAASGPFCPAPALNRSVSPTTGSAVGHPAGNSGVWTVRTRVSGRPSGAPTGTQGPLPSEAKLLASGALQGVPPPGLGEHQLGDCEPGPRPRGRARSPLRPEAPVLHAPCSGLGRRASPETGNRVS